MFPLPHRRWHRLLIGLLLAAVLLKPVFAFDCFCTDPGHGDVPASVAGGEDCCAGQECHDGCAHGSAVASLERPLPLPYAGPAMASPSASPHRPLPTPGVFRPPIAG